MNMKTLVALLVAAAMLLPAAAMAEDRLKLSGSMQVRGQIYDWDDGVNDENGAWNDSRLRIGGKLSVADGVSVVFRFDTLESMENSSDALAWGNQPNAGAPANGASQYTARRSDIQFDLGFLEIVKNGFTLQAGQNFYKLGETGKMMNSVGQGFIGKYAGFSLLYIKNMDENLGNLSFAKRNEGDVSLFGAQYVFKGEGFTVTPMVSYSNDEAQFDRDVLGLGLHATAKLGPVNLKGEFNYFDGEKTSGGTDIDLKGTQLYLDASMNATDKVKIGLMGFYALAQDGDDEQQITDNNLNGGIDYTFARWHPEAYGYESSDFVNRFDIFDPTRVNQTDTHLSEGVMAISLYTDIKATEDLSLQFAALYAVPEDDFIVDYDIYTLNAGFAYKVASNTTLASHAYYVNKDFDDAEEYDSYQIITGLVVNF